MTNADAVMQMEAGLAALKRRRAAIERVRTVQGRWTDGEIGALIYVTEISDAVDALLLEGPWV